MEKVQGIIDDLVRNDVLEALYEQTNMSVAQMMEKDVACLDYSKTARDAVDLMIEKVTEYVIVTSHGVPFGMVTERDILCELFGFDIRLAQLSLGVIASRPLICISPTETVGDVADLMMKNSIDHVPVVKDSRLVGIVVAKDLVMLLSSTKRLSLAKTILESISRSRNV